MQHDPLLEISKEVTEAGDRWRDFAFAAGRICKDRSMAGESYALLSDIMMDCADREEKIFWKLKTISL